MPLTGLIVTKLDSSGKAGFLLGLAAQKPPLPVHYIGMGEGLNDIGPFVAEAFAKGLLGVEED
jgi:fused signal recognition particle receptor